MASFVRDVQTYLRGHDWSLERTTGKGHELWRHGPTGNVYTLVPRAKDNPVTRRNVMKNIQRLEQPPTLPPVVAPVAQVSPLRPRTAMAAAMLSAKVEVIPDAPKQTGVGDVTAAPAPEVLAGMVNSDIDPAPRSSRREEFARNRPPQAGPRLSHWKPGTPWNVWVMQVRQDHNMQRQDIADIIPDLTAPMVTRIEQGARKFSEEELSLWQKVFDITELPKGLTIPLASAAELAKRWGHKTEDPALAAAPPAPETGTGPLQETPAPRVAVAAPTPTPNRRDAVVARASKLLANARLTDSEAEEALERLRLAVRDILMRDLE